MKLSRNLLKASEEKLKSAEAFVNDQDKVNLEAVVSLVNLMS